MITIGVQVMVVHMHIIALYIDIVKKYLIIG